MENIFTQTKEQKMKSGITKRDFILFLIDGFLKEEKTISELYDFLKPKFVEIEIQHTKTIKGKKIYEEVLVPVPITFSSFKKRIEDLIRCNLVSHKMEFVPRSGSKRKIYLISKL